MKCLSCNTEKDMNIKAIYPYNGKFDSIIQDEPIEQLFVIVCQDNDDWRAAILCHDCWHRLAENTQGIDMWISRQCWETLSPVTPFSDLPIINPNTSYKEILNTVIS